MEMEALIIQVGQAVFSQIHHADIFVQELPTGTANHAGYIVKQGSLNFALYENPECWKHFCVVQSKTTFLMSIVSSLDAEAHLIQSSYTDVIHTYFRHT